MNLLLVGCLTLSSAVLYQQGVLGGVLGVIVGVVVSILLSLLACALVISVRLCRGRRYTPTLSKASPTSTYSLLLSLTKERSEYSPSTRSHVVSINTDIALQEIMDLVIRDYVRCWYDPLAADQNRFIEMLKCDAWSVIGTLSNRLRQVNMVTFTTQDFINTLCTHFHEIKCASRKTDSSQNAPFLLHAWLSSAESEIAFLKKLADAIIMYLFHGQYYQCEYTRTILRDILVFKVLQPTFELVCDPDYINQNLLNYLEYREKLFIKQKTTFTYAPTYEDFYKLIETCEDVELLKQFRFGILTEIMQATTINNLKKTHGHQPDKKSDFQAVKKGNLLQSRNLKRYINQLTMSKSLCEKRIRLVGGPEYEGYGGQTEISSNIPGGKAYCRFWIAVERMKDVDKKEKKTRHHVAREVYQMFIQSSTSAVRLERLTIKGMESFMIGDKGPEAFYEAQRHTYTVLEKQHYPSFIVSDVYHSYVSSPEFERLQDELQPTGLPDQSADSTDSDDENLGFIGQQSTYAKNKLREIDEKIKNKVHALDALQTTQKGDRKMDKLKEDILCVIDALKGQRRQLEFHIERTARWWENMGRWKVHIYNSEIVKEGDRMVPYFAIVVDLIGRKVTDYIGDDSDGWVITRSITDLTNLHDQLVQLAPWLKKKMLPIVPNSWFRSITTEFVDKAKVQFEEYLVTLLKDDLICQSEVLYAFLSPSPDYLKQRPNQQGRETKIKRKQSLLNLIKSTSSSVDSEDELLFGDDVSGREEHNKNSIVEPLYNLIREVFELHGAFKMLQKSMMAFVQVTFGRSISRQLRDTVNWLFSEPMIIYYLHMYRDSLWPDGQLADPAPPRSDNDKMRTRLKAKKMFLNNIPDVVKVLVGDKNAREGAIKTFEILQNKELNKHLFYVLLESFLYEAIPELEQIKDQQSQQDNTSQNVEDIARDRNDPGVLGSNHNTHLQEEKHKNSSSPKQMSFRFSFGPSK